MLVGHSVRKRHGERPALKVTRRTWMFDFLEIDRIKYFGRKVTLEVPEIILETSSGILIEWNRQNAWLPKKTIKIIRNGESVTVKLPRWLFDRKFS